MFGTRMLRSLVALLTAVLVVSSYAGRTVAQSTPSTDPDVQARMRLLQERMDELARELNSLKEEQAQTKTQVTSTAKQVSAADTKLATFMKGFFGTLDISIDNTTKGIEGLVAYPYSLAPGVTSPGGPFIKTGGPKAPPFGRVGWLAAMASNGSNIGYRGTHQIGSSDVDLIYQVSTAIDMAAAPGLQNTWTKSSNTVQGAIGLGDTYLGFQNKDWRKYHRWRNDRVPIAEDERMYARVLETQAHGILVCSRRLAAGDVDGISGGAKRRDEFAEGCVEVGRHRHQSKAIVHTRIRQQHPGSTSACDD